MSALKLKDIMSLIAETSNHDDEAAAVHLVLLESLETTVRARPGLSIRSLAGVGDGHSYSRRRACLKGDVVS